MSDHARDMRAKRAQKVPALPWFALPVEWNSKWLHTNFSFQLILASFGIFFYLFPSNLPSLINLSNEVQCSGLVQGINPGTCLTSGSWSEQNHIYYIKCSIEHSISPSFLKLSKGQLFHSQNMVVLNQQTSCSHFKLFGKVLISFRILMSDNLLWSPESAAKFNVQTLVWEWPCNAMESWNGLVWKDLKLDLNSIQRKFWFIL